MAKKPLNNPWTPHDEGDHYPVMKEWWTTEILFKTKDKREWNLMASFAYKMEDKSCFFQYVLFDITSKKYVAHKDIDDKIEKLSHKKNKVDLRYENSTLQGLYPNYKIHIEDKEQNVTIDAMYKARALPHWIAQDINNGYLPIGLNYYRYGFCPDCDVTGTLKFKGKSYKIEGKGYLEHAYGNWSYRAPLQRLSGLRKTISTYINLGKWWLSQNKPHIPKTVGFTTENNVFGYDWIWGIFDNGWCLFYGNSMFWINNGPSLGSLCLTQDGETYLEFGNVQFHYNKSLYIKKYDIYYPSEMELRGTLGDKKIHLRFWSNADSYEYISPFDNDRFHKAWILCEMPGRMEGVYMDGNKTIKLKGDCKIVPLRQPSYLGHNSLTFNFLKPPKGVGINIDLDSHYLKKQIAAKLHLVPRPRFSFSMKKLDEKDFFPVNK